MRTKFACLKITILILSSLLLAQSAFAGMQILFPVESDTKAVSNIHVVGMSDDDTPAQISINGQIISKNLIKAPFGKEGKDFYMLMAILKLEDGENNIRIIQGKDAKNFKITKVDSPVTITDWTKELTGFHASAKVDICKNCHKFENLSQCVNCHKDKFMGAWVHKPVREAKCFECHQKENHFIPQEPMYRTCLKCHTKMNDSLNTAKYTHGPVAAGYCTICHSPHKSTVETHLRKPVNELCTGCHVSGDQGFSIHSQSYIKFHPVDKAYIKKLDKEIECSDCHNPHYSDSPMFLRTQDGEELCVKCHDPQDTKQLLKVLTEKYESK